MRFCAKLNSASVVVSIGGSPQKGGLLLTVGLADTITPFHTSENFPVPHGEGFAERATAYIEARTEEVAVRHGIVEKFVHVSDAGQVMVRVFAVDRQESAVWVPFPRGPISGSWM